MTNPKPGALTRRRKIRRVCLMGASACFLISILLLATGYFFQRSDFWWVSPVSQTGMFLVVASAVLFIIAHGLHDDGY